MTPRQSSGTPTFPEPPASTVLSSDNRALLLLPSGMLAALVLLLTAKAPGFTVVLSGDGAVVWIIVIGPMPALATTLPLAYREYPKYPLPAACLTALSDGHINSG